MNDTIADLIDPEVAERLRTVAVLDPNEKAKKVSKGKIRTIKAATDPNPPRPLTLDDAVTIPPGMTSRFQAECVDCGTTVWLEPTVPDGVDPNQPRYPICDKDAAIRVGYTAIVEQRRIEIVRRNQQAAQAYTNKEVPVIDLNTVADATLGEAVKASIKTKKATKIREDRPKAKAKQVKTEKKARKRLKAEQAARKTLTYKGFRVDAGLVVPDLDLTNVVLDEVVHQVDRHFYNSARFRVLGESALDPETTTWRTLAVEHGRLAKAAKAKRKEWKARGKKALQEVAAKQAKPVVAVLDATEQAKKLAAFTGVTVERATELLAR